MMKAINILAMLLAFNGFCHSKAIQAQDLAIRSLVDYSDLIIRSDDIADGFEAAGQGPTVTKVDSNNETIAIAYIMDQEDWDAMHDHLLEKAYNERLKEALAQSPQEDHDQLREDAQRQLLEALNPKSLVERVDIQDPKTWLCNENGPLPYTYPLTVAVGVGCGLIIHGGIKLGQKGYAKVMKFEDGEDFKDRYGAKIAGRIEWTFLIPSFGTVAICEKSLSRAIEDLCEAVADGNKGEKEASKGIHSAVYKENGKTAAKGAAGTTEL